MATAAVAAKHIFISASRYRDLVAANVIKHRPSGQYRLDEVREQYITNMQRTLRGRGGADGGAILSKQRARLADAQASKAEFLNMQMQGGFVELSLMQRVLEGTFTVMRERALSTAGKCADALTPFTPKDRAEIHAVIQREVHEMLECLSDPDAMAAHAADEAVKGSR
jgi:hypothetical protein